MLYLHDVWVNWADGGSRAHHIPEYFEWRKTDETLLMDTIPMLVVEPELFTVLEDGYVDVPQAILDQIHRIAVYFKPETKRKNRVDYAFVITDGSRVVAINTDGGTKTEMKSRLIPRQEIMVIEMSEGKEPKHHEVPIEELEESDDTLMGRILSLDPEYMVGLTRAEKDMKEIIMDCLFNLSCSENTAEVKYWFIELFPDMIGDEALATTERETFISKMFDCLKYGWSPRHEEFGTLIVKYNDIYKDEWVELVKRNKRLDKVES